MNLCFYFLLITQQIKEKLKAAGINEVGDSSFV
jgi:hypothetical protein